MKKILLYPISYCTEIVYSDIEKYGEVKNIGLDIKETINASGEGLDALYLDFKNKASDDISRPLFDEMLERGVMAPYIGTYYIIKEKADNSLTVEKAWSCDEVYSIPEGVERIGDNCFYKCDRLQKIDIPSTVKEIGEMAFFKCYGISLVKLPEGLASIGCDAFSYCQNMRYAMFIPASVEEIGHHCFYECHGIEKFYLEDASEETIKLGGSWQPKSGNSFKPEPAIFGASYADFESYNNERIAAEQPVVEQPPAEDNGAPVETKPENIIDKIKAWIDSFNVDGTNYLIITILIIVVFIPGMASIVIDVIRKMFKEDFLMSKKKKEKLRKKQEENERLRREYLEQLERENQEEGGNE